MSFFFKIAQKIHINDWLVLVQTHILTQTTVRREAERPKGDREQFAASLDLWITN